MTVDVAAVEAVRSSRPPLALHQLLAGERGRVVVLGGSKDPNRKLTIVVTPEGRGAPRLVVKAPTTDAAETCVLGEARFLRDLEAAWPGLDGVPRVLGEVEFEGRRAAILSGLPGVPMSTLYHRWRHTARPRTVEEDFAAAERWIASFQKTTANGWARPSLLDGVAFRLMQRFDDDPSVAPALSAVDALRKELSELATVRVAAHGDLWCGNLLVSDDDIAGVVDWEAATLSGDPLRDLVRFPLTYSLYLDRHTRSGRKVAGHPGLRAHEWGSGIRYALEGRGWYPSLFRTFLRRGLRRLGLPPRSWRVVAMAGLAEIAATADDHVFARRHVRLLARLTTAESGTQ